MCWVLWLCFCLFDCLFACFSFGLVLVYSFLKGSCFLRYNKLWRGFLAREARWLTLCLKALPLNTTQKEVHPFSVMPLALLFTLWSLLTPGFLSASSRLAVCFHFCISACDCSFLIPVFASCLLNFIFWILNTLNFVKIILKSDVVWHNTFYT